VFFSVQNALFVVDWGNPHILSERFHKMTLIKKTTGSSTICHSSSFQQQLLGMIDSLID